MTYNKKYKKILGREQLNQGIVIQLPAQLKLLIRWMKPWDVPYIQDMERAIFPSPWSAESFLYRLYERSYNISLVGVIGKELVSYAVSYVVHDELHFGNLAVDQKYRGFNIGETMLLTSLQIGKESNCRVVHLEVRENNQPAIRLYQKYGFEIVGVRENYYTDEKEDALLMSRIIN